METREDKRSCGVLLIGRELADSTVSVCAPKRMGGNDDISNCSVEVCIEISYESQV